MPIYFFGVNERMHIAPEAKYVFQYGEVWPHFACGSGVLYSGRSVQPTSAEINCHIVDMAYIPDDFVEIQKRCLLYVKRTVTVRVLICR